MAPSCKAKLHHKAAITESGWQFHLIDVRTSQDGVERSETHHLNRA
jgi:hypothetical protein